ncbi:hypothetical protein Taro_010173 [Colocasia esculenta]|uniref:Aberrant root formation protein 4 n=1 Tax=Colocasia esculenta TaxID=4460 RepID=A0A843U2J5_COLES|nr:hypothetical protein [Colocasia esculenta]
MVGSEGSTVEDLELTLAGSCAKRGHRQLLPHHHRILQGRHFLHLHLHRPSEAADPPPEPIFAAMASGGASAISGPVMHLGLKSSLGHIIALFFPTFAVPVSHFPTALLRLLLPPPPPFPWQRATRSEDGRATGISMASASSDGAAPEEAIDLLRMQLEGDPSSISARLREALGTCTKCLESGDYSGSDKAIEELLDLLNGVVESPSSQSEEALSEIHRYLSSPSADLVTVDALSLELPKVVVRFAAVSDKCRELVEKIVDCLIDTCNPRDMLSMLCEALDSQIKVSTMPINFVVLLRGLSKVLICIKRHHVQQVKVSLPIVLNITRVIASEFVGEDEVSLLDLFKMVISIAASIQSVCGKMIGVGKEELRAILGLYALQNVAFLSMSNLANRVSSCVSFVTELSQFFPFCGLSYLGLVTGCDVDAIIRAVHREDGDDFVSCFSLVKDGALLAVLWGSLYGEVEKAAGENVSTVVNELCKNQAKRWQAIGMVKYVLLATEYPWKTRAHCIELLGKVEVDKVTCHPHVISLTWLIIFQAFEKVMIFAPDAALRKKGFSALRKVCVVFSNLEGVPVGDSWISTMHVVSQNDTCFFGNVYQVLSDIPCFERFDLIKALITNNSSPDMIALLLDLVKEEVLKENYAQSSSSEIMHPDNISRFWSRSALDLVELVLKPPKGGPPSLPEDSSPVLFFPLFSMHILWVYYSLQTFITCDVETTEATSQKRLLREADVQKAYSEWLLPLRTLVSGIEAENTEDADDLACHTLCALNPVQLVLYRCIELAEVYLGRSK